MRHRPSCLCRTEAMYECTSVMHPGPERTVRCGWSRDRLWRLAPIPKRVAPRSGFRRPRGCCLPPHGLQPPHELTPTIGLRNANELLGFPVEWPFGHLCAAATLWAETFGHLVGFHHPMGCRHQPLGCRTPMDSMGCRRSRGRSTQGNCHYPIGFRHPVSCAQQGLWQPVSCGMSHGPPACIQERVTRSTADRPEASIRLLTRGLATYLFNNQKGQARGRKGRRVGGRRPRDVRGASRARSEPLTPSPSAVNRNTAVMSDPPLGGTPPGAPLSVVFIIPRIVRKIHVDCSAKVRINACGHLEGCSKRVRQMLKLVAGP